MTHKCDKSCKQREMASISSLLDGHRRLGRSDADEVRALLKLPGVIERLQAENDNLRKMLQDAAESEKVGLEAIRELNTELAQAQSCAEKLGTEKDEAVDAGDALYKLFQKEFAGAEEIEPALAEWMRIMDRERGTTQKKGGCAMKKPYISEPTSFLLTTCKVCNTEEKTSLDEPAPDMMCECGEVRDMWLVEDLPVPNRANRGNSQGSRP